MSRRNIWEHGKLEQSSKENPKTTVKLKRYKDVNMAYMW